MIWQRCWRRVTPRLALLVGLIGGPQAHAADAACPDAELLSGKLITDVCWSCLFPIRIAGVPIGGGTVPPGASNASVCACPDSLGVPRPGFTIGLWEPARIIELVRNPDLRAGPRRHPAAVRRCAPARQRRAG